MKAPHLPLTQLSEYVRPIPVNSPTLLTRKPLHGNADLYSQHDNRHALKHLLQYFIDAQEDLSSQLTVEQATAYLQQQAGRQWLPRSPGSTGKAGGSGRSDDSQSSNSQNNVIQNEYVRHITLITCCGECD